MKSGIPFDVAFQIDDVTRTAWCIIFSEMEGREFDWDALAFKAEPE